MAKVEDAKGLAELFAALSAPVRMRIALVLCEQEMGVRDLANAIGASPSLTSNHLKVMVKAGVVLRKPPPGISYFVPQQVRDMLQSAAVLREYRLLG